METLEEFEFCQDILNEAHKRFILGYWCNDCAMAISRKPEAMKHARKGHTVREIAGGSEKRNE